MADGIRSEATLSWLAGLSPRSVPHLLLAFLIRGAPSFLGVAARCMLAQVAALLECAAVCSSKCREVFIPLAHPQACAPAHVSRSQRGA